MKESWEGPKGPRLLQCSNQAEGGAAEPATVGQAWDGGGASAEGQVVGISLVEALIMARHFVRHCEQHTVQGCVMRGLVWQVRGGLVGCHGLHGITAACGLLQRCLTAPSKLLPS